MPSPDPRFAPPSPFARLVAAHAASAAGDGCVVAALAGSLFFSQPTGQAREKILLYLLITLAPFAVVAPVLGPALDRVGGGRRLGLVLTLAARTLLALLMSRYVTSVAFYPLAFGMLVMQKGYSVAKSSLVPGLVSNEGELIKANSRLNIMSTVAGAIGAAPAFGIHEGFGSKWSLLLAAVVYAGATVLALKIPKVQAEQTRAEQLQADGYAPVIEVGLGEPSGPEGADRAVFQDVQGVHARLALVAVHAAGPVVKPVKAEGEGQQDDARDDGDFDAPGEAQVGAVLDVEGVPSEPLRQRLRCRDVRRNDVDPGEAASGELVERRSRACDDLARTAGRA